MPNRYEKWYIHDHARSSDGLLGYIDVISNDRA